MLRVIALIASLALCAQASMTWTNCGTAADICPPSNITMTPDPAPRGGSATFTISCTASAVTTGGKVVVDAYIGGTKVKHEDLDYCKWRPFSIALSHIPRPGREVPAASRFVYEMSQLFMQDLSVVTVYQDL